MKSALDPADPDTENTPHGTQSIHRAIDLLRLLAAHNERGVRLVDIARLADLNRSTCHRILQCLVSEGMAAERQPGSRYVLGPLAYELGLGATRRYRLDAISHPLLEALAETTEDAVFLSVRSDRYLSCVDYAIGAYPIKAYTRTLGDRRPLGYGCAGVAILSMLPDATIRQIVEENREMLGALGVTELDAIVEKSMQARHLGYASHARPTLGLRALAVPIEGTQGKPLGALSLCAIQSRIEGERVAFLVDALHDTRTKIEAHLHAQTSNGTHARFGLDDLSAYSARAAAPHEAYGTTSASSV